jgi:hypothetical protein
MTLDLSKYCEDGSTIEVRRGARATPDAFDVVFEPVNMSRASGRQGEKGRREGRERAANQSMQPAKIDRGKGGVRRREKDHTVQRR